MKLSSWWLGTDHVKLVSVSHVCGFSGFGFGLPAVFLFGSTIVVGVTIWHWHLCCMSAQSSDFSDVNEKKNGSTIRLHIATKSYSVLLLVKTHMFSDYAWIYIYIYHYIYIIIYISLYKYNICRWVNNSRTWNVRLLFYWIIPVRTTVRRSSLGLQGARAPIRSPRWSPRHNLRSNESLRWIHGRTSVTNIENHENPMKTHENP
jgi:hypothetical protein